MEVGTAGERFSLNSFIFLMLSDLIETKDLILTNYLIWMRFNVNRLTTLFILQFKIIKFCTLINFNIGAISIPYNIKFLI